MVVVRACLAVLMVCLGALGGMAQPAWTEREAQIDGLAGTLAVPAGAGRFPAVLILPGSGPVDRDGNLPSLASGFLKQLAHDLAARGIASLRIDKRGVGASLAAETREETLRIATYVEDARRWLALLRTEPGVERVYVLGHSEGALIATLAAQSESVAGLILLAGAGEPALRIIERQLAQAGAPRPLQEASRGIANELAQGRAVAAFPPELAGLYRPNIQGYMMSWLPLDPAAELARVAAPVLIVQGTTDLQVDVADARLLAAAQPRARLVLIDGMNHVLRPAPAERLANFSTYSQPDMPLAGQLAPAIADFIGP